MDLGGLLLTVRYEGLIRRQSLMILVATSCSLSQGSYVLDVRQIWIVFCQRGNGDIRGAKGDIEAAFSLQSELLQPHKAL